jgi:hypothetical protein
MENPATWSEDAQAIAAAMAEHSKLMAAGVIGGSVIVMIEDRVVAPLRKRINDLERYLNELHLTGYDGRKDFQK